MYGMDHGVWMLGGWMVMLALWLLPFIFIFFAMKLFFGQYKATAGKSALEILDKEYAGGKISRDEFLQKRDDLQKSRGEL